MIINKRKTYHIETFGCQMNEFDSERIMHLLEDKGFKSATSQQDADIIVINTCAVRKKAENRLFGHIGNLKNLKLSNPDLIICIGGCAAQDLKTSILNDFPYIDIVFGTGNLESLPELIKKRLSLKKNICETENNYSDYKDLYNFKCKYKFKAFLPVIIGCNNYCSYCIVPYVRGREKSVKPDKIIGRIRDLINDGLIEVTLLGQNVNSYGNDFDSEERINFANLLERIAGIKDLKRIRFATSHPKDFSDDLIYTIRDHENIMNHIHLPLQAGSDKILSLMNRKYTIDDYVNLFEKIRANIPDCFITTDIIAGFPGETEEDFEQTLEVVEKLRFNRAFTFIYSSRTGTSAETIKDIIPLQKKKIWFKRLLEIQNKISMEENTKLIGKNFKVLVEGYSKKNRDILEGRLENNLVVNFQGSLDLIGKFADINITDAKAFYLDGKII